MTMRACTICGTPTPKGSRCDQHRTPGYGRPHRRAAAATMRDATVCWICGGPPTANDPLTRDHIIPLSRGGTNTRDNYRAAHYSCNSRRGASAA